MTHQATVWVIALSAPALKRNALTASRTPDVT
jgi:hypothetical protein